ncbi:transglutaminase domain-containing protein [Pseudenhygromyxa sp. WMMC2535]|uniref:transglutaminase-like domain-containing protein n=1 Tax=Pseudenhygromyxa sp. WMMC2535 TaxID=2712867 RepID=UPI001556E870|nr:transglutaminase-like domain-containing protein [Pseudenhygromyxa sp. WMMC2535]NVB41223.1 transglutaminase domain-containing protein [Pseudenhygromyxa sp. WMMC2535]
MSAQRRPSWTALLLLLAWVGASACVQARAPMAESLAPLPADELEARAQLGALGSMGETADALARTAAAAREAAALGNLDEAGAFAREHLDLARGASVIATLGDDPLARDDARERLDAAARVAVDIGDTILDGRLVLEAAQFLREPKRARRAMSRALLTTYEADIGWGYARLWQVFARDPERLVALQRLRWRSYQGMRMPANTPRLSPEQLAALGSAGLDILWVEADRAAREDRREDYRRWLDALLTADPWDPDAMAADLVLDALAREEIADDPDLLPDLAASTDDIIGVQARWQLRHQAAPQSRALALQRATLSLRYRAFGDLAEQLAEIDALAGDPSRAADSLQDTLHALAELERGDAAGLRDFKRWRRRAGAKRSDNLSARLASFDEPTAPEDHAEAALDAARQRVDANRGRDLPRLPTGDMATTLLDADQPSRSRERAHAGFAGVDPSLGSMLAQCRERELFGDDCRDLVAELGKLTFASPDYPDGLGALDLAANTRSSWFAPIPQLENDQLLAIRERLLAFEGSRLAATTHYQTAALSTELAANRPDLAQARLDRAGALLRSETRAIAEMILRDLDEGLLDPTALPDRFLDVPPPPEAGETRHFYLLVSTPPDELNPRSRLWMAATALMHARDGAWKMASAQFAELLPLLEGTSERFVAGRMALAAQLAQEPALRDRALTILEAEAPRAFLAAYTRARVAEDAGKTELAHALYLDALRRQPRDSAAFTGALRTAASERLELARVRESILLFPDADMHWESQELLEAADPQLAAASGLDGPLFTALWLARDDGDALLALGEPATRFQPTALRGLWRLHEVLQNSPSPEQAFPVAARTLAWISAMPPSTRVVLPRERETELWLTALVGDRDELEALANADYRRFGVPQPTSPTHAALLLADARARGDIDDLASWSMVREQLWDIEDPFASAHVAELYAPTRKPSLAQLACLRMFQRDEIERGAERCVPLWTALDGSPFLAADLTFVALNRPELLEGRLEPDALFTAAAAMPELAEDPVWLLNASLWASLRGDHEQGAALRTRQLALEASLASEPDDLELAQARYRGPLLRQQILDAFSLGDRRQWVLAANSAVRGLDLIAAEYYAQRLLFWLPPASVGDEAPELTAASPEALAYSRLEGEISDAELRSAALYFLELSALIRADLDAGRVEREAMYAIIDANAEDDPGALAALEALATDSPDSHVLQLMLLSELRATHMRERATDIARALVERYPESPLILSQALPLLTGPEDLTHAQALLARARELHPDHPWLSDEQLPGLLTGSDGLFAPWLRDPEAFAQRLAAIGPDTLAALAPKRRMSEAVSGEAFFPADTTPNGEGKLGVYSTVPGMEDADEGEAYNRAQFVIREPRASRCEGMGCAEALIAEWMGRDYALLWTRELELPAGPAVEFLVSDGEAMIDNVLVPTGGNLFVLVSGTTPADFEAFLPHVALLHQSFRPLDLMLPASAAETLRVAGARPPADALRLRARLAVGEHDDPQRCPLEADPTLAASWRGLESSARAELLFDLFLTTRSSDQRRALLACLPPTDPAAARLALVALLDTHAAVYEWGRAATRAHPKRVIDDSRRVLYDPPEPATSDPRLTLSGSQPAFGLLQVIAALPLAEAQALTRELLAYRDPRLRAIALAAPATMDYSGSGSGSGSGADQIRTAAAALREVVRNGLPADALLAARSLMEAPSAEDLAALRERADALISAGVDDEGSRALALELAWILARRLDKADRKRLTRLAEAVDFDPADGKHSRAEGTHAAITAILEDYAEGRSLTGQNRLPTHDETPARWARALRSKPAPRGREALASTPLAELLPGRDWTFVRVGDAGLFATSLEGLLRRLTPAQSTDAYLVRALIHDSVLSDNFAIFAADPERGGGLDLAAPIECASPKGNEGFVCSASIDDREQLLATLAARELGDDAGVAIPMSVATEFAALPLSLGGLPIALHTIVEATEEELEYDEAPLVAAERLRATREIAGYELEYYATVELRTNRIIVDSEHYLILGDRLLVFSGSHLAEQLLREPPAGVDTLASQPEFTRATASWRDGVAMQAFDLSETLGLPELALELALDNEGLEFSATATAAAVGGLGSLDALLPADPVSRIALALEPGALAESYEEDEDLARCADHGLIGERAPAKHAKLPERAASSSRCGLVADDKLPPLVLVEAASAVALGWYPAEGDALWQPWVLAMPLDAKLRRAARAAEVELPAAGQLLEQRGLFWQHRDGALVVASTRALAEAAQALPAPAARPAGAPLPFVRGGLDGSRAAAVVRALAGRYAGDRRADYLRLLATMIGLVEDVELSGDWTQGPGEGGQLRARVRLHLAESEEELALIDRWLANPEISNASKLPRRLTRDETERGLAYRIRVEDAASFARTALPDKNPRIRAEVVGDDELRLVVLPSAAVPANTKVSIDAAERERMLAADGLIRADAPALVEIARSLRVANDDAATVRAVIDWAHDHVRYEITPTSLDAVAILERGAGDCTEYALLAVTVLRAAGIPAKVQEGMAASGEEMVAHAWVAWHDGQRWREADPTAGTDHVGAGHLELEVVDVLAMISLGHFEVLAIDPI